MIRGTRPITCKLWMLAGPKGKASIPIPVRAVQMSLYHDIAQTFGCILQPTNKWTSLPPNQTIDEDLIMTEALRQVGAIPCAQQEMCTFCGLHPAQTTVRRRPACWYCEDGMDKVERCSDHEEEQ